MKKEYLLYRRTNKRSEEVKFFITDNPSKEEMRDWKQDKTYTREVLMRTDDADVALKTKQLAEGK